MRDIILAMMIGAAFAALVLIDKSCPASVAKKADRVDTFNGRWMPMLPPQIRTENRVGAPHCIITGCRVV